MMEEFVPFQVQLRRRQHRRLKHLAGQQGRSMGSLVRDGLEAYLASAEAGEDPALGLVGLIDDRGPTPHGPVAVEHDAYLADAAELESGASVKRGEGSGRAAREP